MALKIRASRHGLARCPGCKQHIQLGSEGGEMSCPFCHVALVAEGAAGGLSGLARSVVSQGRGGLIAASLLGLTTLTGCGSDEEKEPANDTASDTNASDATDLGVQPVYGIPADTAGPTDTTAPDDTATPDATDLGVQPAYGLPADTTGPADTIGGDDLGVQPPYGIAPDTTP